MKTVNRKKGNSQDELLNIQNKDPREFWKNIGKIDVGSERQKSIPMEVVLKDGSICTDTDIIIYFKYIENFL